MARNLRTLGSLTTRRFMYYSLTGERTHIPAYDNVTGHPFQRINQIKDLQKFYEIRPDSPDVYLRGTNDLVIYRGMMTAAVVGVCWAFYNIYLVATCQKEKRDTTKPSTLYKLYLRGMGKSKEE